MRFLALATDYDGTLAHNGHVDEPTLEAVERLRESGRKLILVTGRQLDELQQVFPQLDHFEWVVAENGALLFHPGRNEEKSLAEPPPPEFAHELRRRGVERVSTGRVIVATWEPHETTVLEVVRDMALELQVIFNKGAVMVLPTGVNKATGLGCALCEMKLSRHNVVAIGDAENDHALLGLCAVGVAVENALPQLKERADMVMKSDHGRGVAELIDLLLADDLASHQSRFRRHDVVLGKLGEGQFETVSPDGTNILVAGSSGGGKSTLATGFLERLSEADYQFCVIDPEGDYESFEGAVVFGSANQPPNLDEVIQLLESPRQNAIVNLVGLDLNARATMYLALLARLHELRTRTGHPHWIITDEAHHVLSSKEPSRPATLPRKLSSMMFITVEPATVSTVALEAVDVVVAVGDDPTDTLAEFAEAVGAPKPIDEAWEIEPGEAVVWRRTDGAPPRRMEVLPSSITHRRHRRKYAEGDLGEERSFVFTGPDNRLKLKAQNLMIFIQMAEGVDDETWEYHFRRGDFSQWFRVGLKDDELAREAASIEQDSGLSVAESREKIIAAVKERYTAPAQKE